MATAIEEMKALTVELETLNKAAETRTLNAEELKRQKEIISRCSELDSVIEQQEKASELLRKRSAKEAEEKRNRNEAPATPSYIPGDGGGTSKYSKRELAEFSKFDMVKFIQARALQKSLSGTLEDEILARGKEDCENCGVGGTGDMIPQEALTYVFARANRYNKNSQKRGNDITVTGGTSGDEGGVLVQTDVLQPIPVLWNPPCFQKLGVTFVPGLKNDTKLPRPSVTNKSHTKPAGKTEIASADLAAYLWDRTPPTLTPHRLPVYTNVSRQQIIQTEFVQQFIIAELEGMLRGDQEYYAINGGTAQPTGILATSNILKPNLLSGNSFSYQDAARAVALLKQYNIGISDNTKIGFLSTPAFEMYARTTPKVTPVTSGAAFPSFIDDGGMIYNTPIEYSNNMPDDYNDSYTGFIAANWKDIILATFGNGMEVLVNPYTKSKEGEIEVTFAIYWDIAVRRLQSVLAYQNITVSGATT